MRDAGVIKNVACFKVLLLLQFILLTMMLGMQSPRDIWELGA